MLDELDINIIRKLQEDITLEEEPFKAIAKDLKITEEHLLERINTLHNQGYMRRFCAVLHHRKAGFSHNAMVVWIVPDKICDEVGEYMSSLPNISHCYKRITYENWPYNMYTMIHGHTIKECEDVVSEISKQISIKEYKILYSIKELKKTSMKYYEGLFYF